MPKTTKNYSEFVSFKKIVSEIEAIRSKKKGDYKRWYIGVTNELPRRYGEHKTKIETEPYYWYSWYAYTKDIALTIEKHFHDLGMQDGSMPGNVKKTSKYVYIYKEKPDIIDKMFKKILTKSKK